MLNVPLTTAAEYPQQQQSVDLRWMPKDCDGQVRMGFHIIANAFKSKVKALEDDLRAVTEEKTELEGKQGVLVQKLQKLERESLEVSMIQSKLIELEEKLIEKTAELETRKAEHSKRERDLFEENRRLALHFKSLKRKANQLDAFRRIVVETITKEEDFTGGNSLETIDQRGIGQKPSSSHRVSVGSEFQSPGIREKVRERDLEFPIATQNNDSEERRLFRRAKGVLSANQFEQFLDIVRRLNSHSITVEEALIEAAAICSYENTTLYEEFRALLSCNNNVC